SGIETEHISRMLSLGLLGRRRRLVPTRWSITAADDMIGRHLKEAILEMPLLDCPQLFSWEELGNHFEILLLPGSFSFELIEIWMPRSLWAEEGFIGADREDTMERRRYSPLAGGYYAARLAALEHLAGAGRQASVLALREISEAYWAPLGVWVVREVARKALCSPPARPEGLKEAVEEIGRRIRTPVARWLHLSETLAGPRQKRLADFL
ncbi:MAG: hypothetical protein QUS08_05545, partial [Methanothrix sp.]|nr:hypothetical protein [Methanothrix sp.]